MFCAYRGEMEKTQSQESEVLADLLSHGILQLLLIHPCFYIFNFSFCVRSAGVHACMRVSHVLRSQVLLCVRTSFILSFCLGQWAAKQTTEWMFDMQDSNFSVKVVVLSYQSTLLAVFLVNSLLCVMKVTNQNVPVMKTDWNFKTFFFQNLFCSPYAWLIGMKNELK